MWQMPDWLDYKVTLECQMRFGAWVSVLSTSVSLVLMFDRQEDANKKKGYIISQLPATVYLARGRPQIQMPLHVIAWSVITACMAAMTTGWSFVVCRFLVGLAEGPFLPMASVMSSSWYTKEEAPMRMAIWHAGNIASNVFSGLLAAGILTNMDGVASIRAWMWFFILEVRA